MGRVSTFNKLNYPATQLNTGITFFGWFKITSLTPNQYLFDIGQSEVTSGFKP